MQVINGQSEIKKGDYPLAIALGNFDGVHRGHQVLLQCCVAESSQQGWIPSVLLWYPHPRQILLGEGELKYLNSPEQKYELIQSWGIKYLFSFPFREETARLTPFEFAQKYLRDIFRVKKVFVGFNYSFGQKGSGTAELLKTLGEEMGFAVTVIDPVIVDGQVVSSSLIREKYEVGDLSMATKLLGYYPIIEGEVISGAQRGRELGFPTANLAISPQQVLPSWGTYVALAQYNGYHGPALVHLGQKPTFHQISCEAKVTVEAHLLDFSKDIYQEKLKISFLKKIRSEKKFPNGNELKAQMQRDLIKAKQILGDFQKA